MAREILKQKRLRVTPFREKVLAVFIQNTSAVSLDDIEKAIGEHDRITLYRTLKTFVEKGVIHEILIPGEPKKLALCSPVCSGGDGHHEHNHVHFQCKKCQETFCIEIEDKPSLSLGAFRVENMEIQASGICEKCS